MARPNVKLDLRGLEEVATSREMHAAVNEAAHRVAEAVEAQGIRVIGEPGDIALPVVVREDETTRGLRVNRALAAVQINHASGLAVQAKHGALSKAASSAGLRLRGD
jgi:hypothetical protein